MMDICILLKQNNSLQSLESITTNKDKEGVRISEIAEYDLGNQILGLNLVSLELDEVIIYQISIKNLSSTNF